MRQFNSTDSWTLNHYHQIFIENFTIPEITVAKHLNVYSYNMLVLVLNYAVIFMLALFGVVVGILVYIEHDVSRKSTFSSILTTA
jgi:hypothetical protein